MDKAWIEILARMNFYEFLLEVQCANNFAHCTEPQRALESFRTDFIDRVKYRSYVRGEIDDEALAIQARMAEIAEQFFDKASERMNGIIPFVEASRENNTGLHQQLEQAAEQLATRITNGMTDEEVRSFISSVLQPVDSKQG